MSVYEVLSLATNVARQMQGEMMVTGRPYQITHYTVGNHGHDPEDRYNALTPNVNLTDPTDEVISPQLIDSVVPYDTASGFGPTWICVIPAGLATGVVSSLYLWADMAKPQVPGYPVPPQLANLPTTGTVAQTCEVLEWGYYQWNGGAWSLHSVPPNVTVMPVTPAVGQTVTLTLADPPYAPGTYVYDGVMWQVIATVIALPSPALFVYDVAYLFGTPPPTVPSKYVWDSGSSTWVNLYLAPVATFADLTTAYLTPVIGQRAYVVANGAEYYWNNSFWEHVHDRFLFSITDLPEMIKLDSEADTYRISVQF